MTAESAASAFPGALLRAPSIGPAGTQQGLSVPESESAHAKGLPWVP